MDSATRKGRTRAGAPSDLDGLVSMLGSDDGEARQEARNELVTRGEAAVPALAEALSSPRKILRWEAAKTLTELRSPAAAGDLVAALEDESSDVRWLAAEALIRSGREALDPLLRAIAHGGDSPRLRDGAHHVLRDLALPELAETVGPLLDALRGNGNRSAAVPAAERALERLQRGARP